MGWHEKRAWIWSAVVALGAGLLLSVLDVVTGVAAGFAYALGIVVGFVTALLFIRATVRDEIQKQREEQWRWPT